MNNIFVVVPGGIEADNGERDYWHTAGALTSLSGDHGSLLHLTSPAASWEEALTKVGETHPYTHSLIIRQGYYVSPRHFTFESIPVVLTLFAFDVPKAVELAESTVENAKAEQSLCKVKSLSDAPSAIIVNQRGASAILAGASCDYYRTNYKMLARLVC